MLHLESPAKPVIRIIRSVTINRSPAELYGYWRELENLPRFMSHLQSVRVLDERTSRWVVHGPAGRTLAWNAEITEEYPNERLAWRSSEQSEIQNAGCVWFKPAPGRRGTELTVELEYVAPAGMLGRTIARLSGEEPSQQLEDDLRRFKWVMEAGEVPIAVESCTFR